MALKPTPALAAGAAITALLLTACQADGIGGGSGDDSTVSPTASESPTALTDSSAEPSDEPTQGSDGANGEGDDGAADETENYVIVGGARYGADSVECSQNDGGLEVGAFATTLTVDGVGGTLESSTFIGGVFGVGEPEDPPDTVFVMFDEGAEGQWSATTEVQGFSLGSLSNVSYAVGSGADGDATFEFQERGSASAAGQPAGSFQFVC